MKKYILIAIAALFILGGGGTYIATHQNSQPAPQSNSQSASSKSSSSSSAASSSSQDQSSSSQSADAQSSSSSQSSESQSSSAASSSSHTGEAAQGDQTVNGKKVTKEQISIIQERLHSLGYNPDSWSPQDIINFYRYATEKGHSDPADMTKKDVEGYLKQ